MAKNGNGVNGEAGNGGAGGVGASAGDAVTLVEHWLDEAVVSGATDLHFEPIDGVLRVRMRIDGLLQEVGEIRKSLADTVIGRLMVLAGLLTYRMDIPQEGRLHRRIEVEGGGKAMGEIGFRISTFPTIEGTRAVIRVLRPADGVMDFASLGYSAEAVGTLVGLTRRRSGLVLLTGPAGSGKTTSIYTFLRTAVVDQAGLSVLSLEDPVEQKVAGVTQIQITPHGELTYQRALRSLLRQDPQMLALGEIRDAETAEICIEAALAGHVLISTIHSGTVAGAIVRLGEMGIPAYQLTSAVEAIVAQRLVRRLCPTCARKTGDVRRPMEAVGCERCNGTGYHGRTVIAEIGLMAGAFRAAVRRQADLSELEAALAEDGMVGLGSQAEMMIAAGVTTAAEVQRVLGGR